METYTLELKAKITATSAIYSQSKLLSHGEGPHQSFIFDGVPQNLEPFIKL